MMKTEEGQLAKKEGKCWGGGPTRRYADHNQGCNQTITSLRAQADQLCRWRERAAAEMKQKEGKKELNIALRSLTVRQRTGKQADRPPFCEHPNFFQRQIPACKLLHAVYGGRANRQAGKRAGRQADGRIVKKDWPSGCRPPDRQTDRPTD